MQGNAIAKMTADAAYLFSCTFYFGVSMFSYVGFLLGGGGVGSVAPFSVLWNLISSFNTKYNMVHEKSVSPCSISPVGNKLQNVGLTGSDHRTLM